MRRLAIHAGTLRGLGSAVVGKNLLLAMAGLDDGPELLAWVPAEWGFDPTAGGGRLTVRTTRPGVAAKLVLESAALRRGLARFRADALLSLGDTSVPYCAIPHVLFVQQAYLAYAPAALDFPLPRRFRLKMRAMAAWLEVGLRTTDRVIVQSEHMRQAFAARWGYPLHRLFVVPSTVQHEALDPPLPDDAESGRRPWLSYVSSAGPHKNHEVLAPMMEALRPRHPELRCRLTVRQDAVPGLVARAERLGVLDRFEFEGAVPAVEAMAMVRGAAAVVVPSRLESFGIPYYEAMALGRPIVAADRLCAREALGEAALYAPADDGHAFAAQVASLLDAPAQAARLASAARERFLEHQMTWPRIARAMLDVVRSL
ncbi:MAG: glycosyltransferase [Deltaproteobacteria bacterium]|nr:glycosyltransferase [Deltaproteobacteria bacterium]MCB9785447.1 glycosyltransferase [Deltaproteobacteria bacterium]